MSCRCCSRTLVGPDRMKEGVTTLPGSLGVNPPQWATAHKDVPPYWLNQEGRPCMIGGQHGTMQIVDGRLICAVTPRESSKMMNTIVENIGHDDLKSMGYTHTRTNEYGLGGTRDHHFTHPDEITKDTINKLHGYLKPLGFQKEKGGGTVQASWTKGSRNQVIITRRLVGTRNEGHKLQISEPRGEKESAMNNDVITEGYSLRFSSPSRTQIAKAQVYWDCLRRNTPGLGAVRVSTIQGTQGNWFFDVAGGRENQFLDPGKLNNILPDGVTVTTGGPDVVHTINASQNRDDARSAILEMVEERLNVDEATWHQQRRPTKLYSDDTWNVVTDPPNEGRSIMSHKTREGAEEFMRNLAKNNPHAHKHSYVLAPANASQSGKEGRSAPVAKWTPETARRRVGGTQGT